MLHHGRRAVEDAVAIELCVVGDIDILEVGEVMLVEETDRTEECGAVHRGTGAGREYDGFPVPDRLLSTLAEAMLELPAEEGIGIAGIINLMRIMHLHHLAGEGEDTTLRILIHALLEGLDEVRTDLRIIIEQQCEIVVLLERLSDALIDRPGETEVCVVLKQLPPRRILRLPRAEPGDIISAGSIVDYEGRKIRHRLTGQRLHAVRQEAKTVVVRNHDQGTARVMCGFRCRHRQIPRFR